MPVFLPSAQMASLACQVRQLGGREWGFPLLVGWPCSFQVGGRVKIHPARIELATNCAIELEFPEVK